MKAPWQGESLLHYSHPLYEYREGVEWREVEPFERTLTLKDTRRGRSAAYFIWVDALGNEYPMFMTDVADLIRRGCIEFGVVHDAMWTVRKRGQNFGIRLADSE
jgi:hypothetical protein